jgi:hypothetical protein
MSRKIGLSTLALLAPFVLAAAALRLDVARFSAGDLDGWQSKSFAGETRYTLVDEQGVRGLRADSDGTASGLYREVAVDLRRAPVLHWSWKIAGVLDGNDERTRAGDDYPARVYVVFSGGLRFWRTRAINYVWSSHQPVGSEWPNAFTANARMIAVDSGDGRAGEWVTHSRDVREDYRRLFRAEPGRVDAVAIMTDTDNTGQSATAWYGDIWFSSR